MNKNKNVMMTIMAFCMSVILVAGCAQHITDAYAEELSVGTIEETFIVANDKIETNETEEKDKNKEENDSSATELTELDLAKKEGYKTIEEWKIEIAKQQQEYIETIETWKNYLTEKQLNKLSNNSEKILAATTLTEIKTIKDASEPIFQAAQSTKAAREKGIQKANKYYSKYKTYLTKEQKEKVEKYYKEINSVFSQTTIDKKAEKIKTIALKGKKIKQMRAKAEKKSKAKYKEYKKYLTPKQQSKVVKQINKIDNKFTKKDINSIVQYVKEVAKKGKSVKITREKAIAKINSCYKQFKSFLSAADKQFYLDKKSIIKSSYNLNDINWYADDFVSNWTNRFTIPGFNTNGWSVDKINFVKEWGRKNNAFLAGTPMAGIGYHIANAAYDTGIDPAAMAAISKIESGCGQMCCGSYNAYGWIWPYAKSFSSWEDGVYQWHNYFSQWFSGDVPLSSMHGYGGYGIGTIWGYLEQIRNA